MPTTLSITDCVSAGVRGEAEETSAAEASERRSTDAPTEDHSAENDFQYQPLDHPQTIRRQRSDENCAPGI